MGSLFGGGQAQQAANQASAAQNSIIQSQLGSVDKINSQYFGAGGTQANLQQAQQGLAGAGTGALTNPGYSNAFGQAAAGTADRLANFASIFGPQNQALANTQAASNSSLLASEQSRLGGVANPGAVFRDAGTSAAQSDASGVQALGAQTGAQAQSALGTAGQLQSGLSSQTIGANTSGYEILSSLLGLGTQALGLGLGAGTSAAGTYGQQAAADAQAAAASNPLNILAGLIGSGAKTYGSIASGGAAAALPAATGAVDLADF